MAEAGLRSEDGGQAGVGLLSILPSSLALVALACSITLLRSSTSPRRSRWVRGLVLASVALNVVWNNPFTATRYVFFSVLLTALVTCVSWSSSAARRTLVIASLFGLTVLYPLANIFRNERTREEGLDLTADAFYGIDFDGFQQLVNTVTFVESRGHTWGHHLLSAVFFWVPRDVWEAKAVPASFLVAAERGYTFQNLSLPLWAELFLELSWPGVALGFFFYGRFCHRLDVRLIGRTTSTTRILAAVLAGCQIGLLRGPLGAQVPFAASALIAAYWILSRSSPTHRSSCARSPGDPGTRRHRCTPEDTSAEP